MGWGVTRGQGKKLEKQHALKISRNTVFSADVQICKAATAKKMYSQGTSMSLKLGLTDTGLGMGISYCSNIVM